MNISKKHILALFKQREGAIHFDDLLREFGGRHVKRELKNMLEDMAEDGEMVRLKGNSYSLPGKIKTIRGRISVHRDGYGFVTPEGGGEDIFIPSKLPEKRHARRHGRGTAPSASRMGGEASWTDGLWRSSSGPPAASSGATRRPGAGAIVIPERPAPQPGGRHPGQGARHGRGRSSGGGRTDRPTRSAGARPKGGSWRCWAGRMIPRSRCSRSFAASTCRTSSARTSWPRPRRLPKRSPAKT